MHTTQQNTQARYLGIDNMLPTARASLVTIGTAATAAALWLLWRRLCEEEPPEPPHQRRRSSLAGIDGSAEPRHWLCNRLPKVELHAHLHGSARLTTIAELAPPGVDVRIDIDGERTLDGCFALFAAIHKTVTSLAAVRRITAEVLADFAADNVKYLELRTTPRALSDASIEDYVRAVLKVFERFEREQKVAGAPFPLVPRLLLSVDRSGTADAADATVALAARLRAEDDGWGGVGGLGRYIVGVDFSGNPTKSSFAHFSRAFDAARAAGLRTVVHVAEIDDEADTSAVLAFRPDRLGHALHLSAAHVTALRAAPIPIELCPTSNMKTLKLGRLAQHPTLKRWVEGGYPVSINTDDSGVFSTTASHELAMVAETLRLPPRRIADLAAAALEHAFDADADFRAHYRDDVDAALEEYAAHNPEVRLG